MWTERERKEDGGRGVGEIEASIAEVGTSFPRSREKTRQREKKKERSKETRAFQPT